MKWAWKMKSAGSSLNTKCGDGQIVCCNVLTVSGDATPVQLHSLVANDDRT